MKNLINKSIVVALLVLTVASVSVAEVPVSVKVAGEKSIELFLGEISGKVWISFKDKEGNVYYSKRIKDLTSYKVKYDLAAFPDGEYQLELSESTQTLNVPVTIENGIVNLKEELAAAPSLSKKGNMVAVELSGKQYKTWDVLIKNEEGELIFAETIENEKVSKRKYDLSNLNDGKYILEFTSAGNSFTHSIVKN